MVQARRQHSVFATGAFEVLDTANPSVLAYLRRQMRDDEPEDIVLCVYNLSKVAQPVELEPDSSTASARSSCSDGSVPPHRRAPYFVTLPSYGFYWFSLVDQLGDDLRSPATAVWPEVAATVTAVETGIQTAIGTQINAPADLSAVRPADLSRSCIRLRSGSTAPSAPSRALRRWSADPPPSAARFPCSTRLLIALDVVRFLTQNCS